MLVVLMDLGHLYQWGQIRLNSLPVATLKGRREAGIEVPMRQLSFVSYTILYRLEICYTIFNFLWKCAIAQLNTGVFFSCFIKSQFYVIHIVSNT